MNVKAFEHGFRHDPMEWAQKDGSLQAALVRSRVLSKPKPGDEKLIQQEIDKILAKQLPDGRLSDDPKHSYQFTAEALSRLAELGCPAGRAEVKKAVACILGKPKTNQADPYGIYDVRAFCNLGLAPKPTYRGIVRKGIEGIMAREKEWSDIWEGCPWTPIEHLITLWGGREAVEVEPCVVKAIKWLGEGINEAGCISYKDPWGFVRLASVIDHPMAKAILEKEIPVILRGQRPDGGWGDRSLFVFRALKTHGLLEPLRAKPPLPPDWRIVKTLPAPEADCSMLAWDGERLWTRCGKRNEAVAISPDDGKVVRRVKLPTPGAFGLAAWDGDLAVTDNKAKKLLRVDAATGKIEREIDLKTMDWINGVTQVGGKLAVGDGFLGCVMLYDPAKPAKPEPRVLGGPIPVDLATDGDAVWHLDVWAPALIKSGLDRHSHLLDWGEKPFDGRCDGIAFDGTRLWALDAKGKRICAIEKSGAATAKGHSAVVEDKQLPPQSPGPALKRDDGKVWIEGIERYRVMDPVFEGIRLILASRGDRYSPEYIQGISGSAFRIGGICPCAPTCENAMQPHVLLRLLGYEFEHVKIKGKGDALAASTQGAVARVRQEIDAGRAALVWHAFTNAEWDVVYGYDAEKKQLLGRGSYAGNDKPFASAGEMRTGQCGEICPPQGVILIGRRTGEFDAPKAEIAALKEAVRHARDQKGVDTLGGKKWHMLAGIPCYDRWIRDFGRPDYKRGIGDAYCYGVYRSTHAAAAGFLREIAPRHPAMADALKRAADQFETEAKALAKGEKLLWWNAPEGPDPKRNAAAAALLKQARDAYAAGIAKIDKALGASE